MRMIQWLLWLVLLVASMATCTIAAKGGGVSSDIGWVWTLTFFFPVMLFAVSPYMFLGWQNLRARNTIQVIVIMAGAILLAAYAITTLHGRLGRHEDAYRGLWLLIIPGYQWVACGIIAVLVFLLGRKADLRQDREKPQVGMGGALNGATKYDDLPWYRRSSVLSKFIIAGIFFAPALLPACIAAITGPVYYKQAAEDGSLRKWKMSNKAVSLMLLALESYIFVSILLR